MHQRMKFTARRSVSQIAVDLRQMWIGGLGQIGIIAHLNFPTKPSPKLIWRVLSLMLKELQCSSDWLHIVETS